jgi:hypothetical protein
VIPYGLQGLKVAPQPLGGSGLTAELEAIAPGKGIAVFGSDVFGRRPVGLAGYKVVYAPQGVYRKAGPAAGEGKRRFDPGHDIVFKG